MLLHLFLYLLGVVVACCNAFSPPVALQPCTRVVTSPSLYQRRYLAAKKDPEEGSSYVPSGLSEQEYDKIKKKEKESQEKKNYGRFGPRFLQTGVPKGDWLLMPNLWTGGFNANKKETGDEESVEPVYKRLIRYTPSFVLSVNFINFCVAGTVMFHSSKLRPWSALKIAIQAILWKRRNANRLWTITAQMLVKKYAIASLLAIPTHKMLERMEQRWTWSNRKAIFVSFLSGLGLLSLWSALLIGIRVAG